MLGVSVLVIAGVAAAVLSFTAWLVGLLALVIVSRNEIDVRHPRMADRLDQTVWCSWIAATAVMFGPAFGLMLAALLAD